MNDASAAVNDTDIAIIGMALRVPGADTLEQFWAHLRAGVESITRFSDDALREAGVDDLTLANPNYVKARGALSDVTGFDPAFFGLTPREAAVLDPQHRLFLECAWHALEHAGCPAEPADGPVGVYAGAGTSLYLMHHLLGNPAVAAAASWFEVALANSGDALPTRTSYALDLRGPSVNVQTACSTSLVAVHLAVQALLHGECRVALAGGVSLDLPQTRGYWYQDGMILSPDGHCRTFDAQARGTVPGSGVGVVVLKRLVDAIDDGDTVHAVIKGTAINNDGRHKIGFTAPSTEGQASVIAEALQVAGVEPASIGYVEAHGTATPLGDPIEVAALAQALGAGGHCAIGSVKSNLGHLNTAAGVVGLIKAALSVRDGEIVPSLHFHAPNAQLGLDATPFHVPTALTPWNTPVRRAGVSSFGMGGTNAHVVLEQAPAWADGRTSRAAPDGWQLLPLSARSTAALAAATVALGEHLAQHPRQALADVAFTLQRGRRAFAHRAAWVCRDAADALAQLRGGPAREEAPAALRALAERWRAGEAVDWPAVAGHRVPLPGYPFEHQRCWIEPPTAAAVPSDAADPMALPPRTPDLRDWFYQPVWRERPATAAIAPAGPVLLLADAHGLAQALARRLAASVPVIMAQPGDAFACVGPGHYTLRPSVSADHAQLLSALESAGQRPSHIVFACALQAGPAQVPAAAELLQALPARLDLGLHALLALVQALALRPAGERHALLVALSCAQDLLDDHRLQPDQAVLLGAAKIVQQEHPNIRCRCADIGAADDPGAADALWQALRDDGADVVMHRGGRRWVEAYEAIPVAPPAQPHPRLRDQGVYLVTGGLGGMGLAFAEALAAQCRARLVLVGRSVFPPRADWDEWLREHGQAGGEAQRVCDTIGRLRAIEASGAQLEIHAADVSDAARMREILDDTHRRFGAVHGVLHAAGVADYEGVIRARTREQTERTIAAKVQGTLVLDALTAREPLDFFLMCSSLGTVLYHIKFGQVGYAAANEFIDHYARARRARGGPGHTVAINWSDWRESGMSVAALQRWARRQHLDDVVPDAEGLSDEEGRQVMLRALAQDAPRVAVAQHDLAVLIRQDPMRARAFMDDAASTQARPQTGTAYLAPRDEIERRIASVWQKLLGLERVGVEDDFYDLGGHSLLATQVVARVNDALAVDIPVDDFLESPTVAALAALVRSARKEPRRAGGSTPDGALASAGIAPRQGEAPLPLSFAQQRLWLLHQIEPDPAAYNMPMALALDGALDVDALQRALQRIVERHESLRTTFAEHGGKAVQQVAPAAPFALPLRDLSTLPPGEREAQARAAAEQEARKPFDISREWPIRACLVRLAPERHLFLLTQHHIASDGWSLGVLTRELGALYTAFAQGGRDPLPPLPVQYADFALWQQSQMSGARLQAGLDWWRERLEGVPDLQLPADLPRPAERSGLGGLIGVPLPAELCERLDRFCRGANATRFMVLLAAFFVLLQRYSGQDDFAIGTPIANRTRPEIEPLIGFFANTLVLRAALDGQPDFATLVERVRADAQAAFAHQEVPFEKLVDAMDAAGTLDRTPLFQVLFAFQNAPAEPLRLPGLQHAPLFADTATAKFDLTLSVVADGPGLHALFEYSSDLFLPDTISTMARHYADLLSNLLTQPDLPVTAASLEAEPDGAATH